MTFVCFCGIIISESEVRIMTFEEKKEILTFITQELIAPLFNDFRTGDEIWEKEHLKLFNKSQNFLENLLTNK